MNPVVFMEFSSPWSQSVIIDQLTKKCNMFKQMNAYVGHKQENETRFIVLD